VRATGSPAQVEHWDEEVHRCKTGDTYDSISKQHYNSEKYAQALRLFNRSHPQANDGVRADQPLQLGWTIFLPPTWVLERRHGSAIPGYAPMTPAGSGGTSGGMSAAPSRSKVYEVRGNDESMYLIAQRTLGKGDEWPEIKKLNPNVSSEGYLRPGTRLLLPDNAVVP
jgi:hypothetical protein